MADAILTPIRDYLSGLTVSSAIGGIVLGGIGTLSLVIGTVIVLANVDYIWVYYLKPRRKHTQFIKPGDIRNVCVIGAGSSGITGAKEALQAGFKVTVFEQAEQIGGNWVFRDETNHSSVYRSTFINTSRQIMQYSDYPMPKEYPTYPHHKQIVAYFNDYAKDNGVVPHIKFNTQVVNIEERDDGKWEVVTRATGSDAPQVLERDANEKFQPGDKTHVFDAVMVCNGHHSAPRMPPKFEGQDKFKGKIFHSHSYKDERSPMDMRDKRVVVLGIGNSGVDIAQELSHHTTQVYLATRTGAWIFPKYLHGRPLDHVLAPTRLAQFLFPSWMMVKAWFSRMFFEPVIVQAQGTMESWGLDTGAAALATHPTVAQDLLHRIGNGTIRIKPQIAKFSEDSVHFVDGTVVEADAVIFATGYHISFPFLPDTVIDRNEDNAIDMYHLVWLPKRRPTISFLGLIQPLGAIMPISEMQARWTTAVWQGKIGLPSQEGMEAQIREDMDKIRKRYLKRQRHTIQRDFFPYLDFMAAELGCLPSFLRNLGIFRELMLGPIFPTQYRLNGPDAWDGAQDCIRELYHEVKYERPEKEASTGWNKGRK